MNLKRHGIKIRESSEMVTKENSSLKLVEIDIGKACRTVNKKHMSNRIPNSAQ